MPSQISKTTAQQQQVQQQRAQHAHDVEKSEHHAKASASAGLNLNLLGALSGALSSVSRKTTHTAADGSSTSVEERDDKAAASALARGSGRAFAAADAEEGSVKSREIADSTSTSNSAATAKGVKRVDHLGIEG